MALFNFGQEWKIVLAKVIDSPPDSEEITVLTEDGRTFKNLKTCRQYMTKDGKAGYLYRPATDSLCLVVFRDSDFFLDAYILGYLNIMPTEGERDLLWGDIMWITPEGQYIRIKNNGQIQILSNPQLFTKWQPEENYKEDYCERWYVYTNGGKFEWEDKDNKTTLLMEMKDNFNEKIAHKIKCKLGFIDGKNIVNFNVDGKFDIVVDFMGNTKLNINDKYILKIDKDGNKTININKGKYILDITNEGIVKEFCEESYTLSVPYNRFDCIKWGSEEANQSLIMGNNFYANILKPLINTLLSHTHTGNHGAPTPLMPPAIADLTALLTKLETDLGAAGSRVNLSKKVLTE